MQEFSRQIDIDDIKSAKSIHKDISANDKERKDICERLNFSSLEQFVGHLDVSYDASIDALHLKGRFFAKLEQPCIASLEPVPEEINVDVDEFLVIKQKNFQRLQDTYEGDSTIVLADIDDNKIDLGEIITQNLSVSVEQFPRKEGYEIPEDYTSKAKKNAFSVLEGAFSFADNKE